MNSSCGVGQAIYTTNGNGCAVNVRVNYWNGGTQYKIQTPSVASVSCGVSDLKGGRVIMHCPETPEFYFSDYGQGQLINGKAHIDLDPIYANSIAINDQHPLRVYVQLEGDCNGVYVTNKTISGFDVVELKGGTSNVTFQWNVVCNVADNELPGGKINHCQDLRYEPAPEDEKIIGPLFKDGRPKSQE